MWSKQGHLAFGETEQGGTQRHFLQREKKRINKTSAKNAWNLKCFPQPKVRLCADVDNDPDQLLLLPWWKRSWLPVFWSSPLLIPSAWGVRPHSTGVMPQSSQCRVTTSISWAKERSPMTGHPAPQWEGKLWDGITEEATNTTLPPSVKGCIFLAFVFLLEWGIYPRRIVAQTTEGEATSEVILILGPDNPVNRCSPPATTSLLGLYTATDSSLSQSQKGSWFLVGQCEEQWQPLSGPALFPVTSSPSSLSETVP